MKCGIGQSCFRNWNTVYVLIQAIHFHGERAAGITVDMQLHAKRDSTGSVNRAQPDSLNAIGICGRHCGRPVLRSACGALRLSGSRAEERNRGNQKHAFHFFTCWRATIITLSAYTLYVWASEKDSSA